MVTWDLPLPQGHQVSSMELATIVMMIDA